MLMSYLLCYSVVQLPATDGSLAETSVPTTYTVKPPHFGQKIPPSTISRIEGNKAENIVVQYYPSVPLIPVLATKYTFTNVCFGVGAGKKKFSLWHMNKDKRLPTPHVFQQTKLTSGARLTPAAICWTATSDLFVGCAEGYLFPG